MEGTAEKQAHYKRAAMQPIQVMQCLFTQEQFEGFLLGNFIKYRMRANYKGSTTADHEKARQYLYWYTLVHGTFHTVDPEEDVPPDDWKVDDVLTKGIL